MNTYIDEAIEKYAAAKGADSLGTGWAKLSAHNAIEAGKSADFAIVAGMKELDRWMAIEPRINRPVAEQCVRDAGMEAQT